MKRFNFGKNWLNFTKSLNNQQIVDATQTLQTMLGRDSLEDLTFLDIGCGSGIFSLSAFLLKANKVTSFDYDINSVKSTQSLHDKYNNPKNWSIFRGDVLDKPWLTSLGQFDIVYSWGVLHHTGDLWQALDHASLTVKPNGIFFISIYNDQGLISKLWVKVKHLYNRGPFILKWSMTAGWFLIVILNRIIQGIRHKQKSSQWFKGSERGMNLWYDTVDWIGGYPFETAKPGDLINFFGKRRFELVSKKLKSGSGCNELVFRKLPD